MQNTMMFFNEATELILHYRGWEMSLEEKGVVSLPGDGSLVLQRGGKVRGVLFPLAVQLRWYQRIAQHGQQASIPQLPLLEHSLLSDSRQ